MASSSDTQQIVVKTLAYSDLFDYPLKKRELAKWAIGATLPEDLSHVNGVVFRKKEFFFLKERGDLVLLRKKRERYAHKKLIKARSVAQYLSFLPTVKLVGISGSLSLANAQKDDDIDLFVITSPNTLWVTRLLAIFLLEILGVRRRPYDTWVKDKVCLNMLLSENHLRFPHSRRNLFTAHEICQMKVLFSRDLTYERFVDENAWVKNYLPNALDRDTRIFRYKDTKRKGLPNILISQYLNIFERLARIVQLAYMKMQGRSKPAALSSGILGFYPKSFHKDILKRYNSSLKKYGIQV